MSRRFTLVTVTLTAVVSFLVGAIIAGGVARSAVSAGAPGRPGGAHMTAARTTTASPMASLVNFADVVERLNPAVVNIDTTARTASGRRRRGARPADPSDQPEGPFQFGPPKEADSPRRGAGSGFIIDPDGSILTNHHVVDRAERITVKLSDGRTMRARLIGSDPDTDIALIKVDGQGGLPVAPLGDSATLRMGEWVCAIGNPLGYEHSVTVGVVSFLGRKLFDMSLDNYIQTDAAINFGNSGGPLINTRGEVIGINSAISSRASNIGFAVPINQAVGILPQLKSTGHVSRGYMGVLLTDVTPALQRSLTLSTSRGALVQDVTNGSPAERAGLHTYDVILDVEGRDVGTNEELIREISARQPGTTARLGVLRDERHLTLHVKLAERPPREDSDREALDSRSRPRVPEPASAEVPLGLTVRDLVGRVEVPDSVQGVIVSRVDPTGAAFSASIRRGFVIMEINRHAIRNLADYQHQVAVAKPGDVLALYCYDPT